MNKRIVCFLLALVMVLGLFPAAATTAHAASKLSTSDDAIEILQEFEGFAQNQYQSGGKYYIGYGSEIKNGAYPNGISKDDALILLQEDLTDVDKDLNDFTRDNNLTLTQYEHDALALFCYGYRSTAWLDGNGPLRTAVLQGKTGNEFINAIAQSYGGDASIENLEVVLNRRLAEANMYLNNSYGYNAPENYTYVVLDLDGDKTVEKNDMVIAYDADIGKTLAVVPTAAQSGCDPDTFLGWYKLSRNGTDLSGEAVTYLDETVAGRTLIAKFDTGNTAAHYYLNTSSLISRTLYPKAYTKAEYKANIIEGAIGFLESNTVFEVNKEAIVDGVKWARGSGVSAEDGESTVIGWIYLGELPTEDTESHTVLATATLTSNVNVREGATAGSEVTVGSKSLGTLAKGTTVNIYDFVVEATETGNKNWGKVINVVTTVGNTVSGWINLAYADVKEITDDSDTMDGYTGYVINTNRLNVRSGPGTNYDQITSLVYGTEVTVLQTKMNGSAQWGEVEWGYLKDGYTKGWVYMYYIEVEGFEHSDPESNITEPVLYTGVVTSNINLNVREKPKVTGDWVTSLPNGTKVNIYEVTTTNGVKWGRIGENRWVCLQYVSLTEVDQSQNSGTTTTSLQGTVTTATLDILQNYNSNSAKLGTLKKGDVVTILEKNTEITGTGSRIWGRIIKDNVEGWINLAYVELKTVTSVNGSNSGTNNVTSNANGASAVISNCISVNVRKGAGVTKEQITKLNNGTAIKVYEQVTKDNAPWARITWNNDANEGWVCMNYVTMASSSSTAVNGSTINGTNSNTISAVGTVNSNIDLKVRAGGGLGYAQIGSLKKGTKVTIYEQVTNDGLIWGRMVYGNGSGWVCMSYITVDSVSSTGKGVMGTVARCFAAVNVRSAPGTGNALVSTIAVGNRVEVFETKEHAGQMWGRVAQGWVCMDYILLDSELPPGTILDATEPTTAPTNSADPEETINRDNEVLYTINGKVVAASKTDVRNDANADSDRVGTVNNGLEVKILALKLNGAELWGRIDQYATAGWVNMDDVSYYVKGYVNTEDQPVFANPDTNSTVKDTLNVNTELMIHKLTLGGETVYGWVDSISGWIPMGRISDEPIDVIPVYKSSTDSTGHDVTTGTTNSEVSAVSEVNGSKVVFKLKSGVKVYIGEIRIESGIIWGELKANGVTGWINLANVNYTLPGTVAGTKNVRSSKVVMDDDDEPNNKLGTVTGNVTLCELSFDGDGNLWGKVTGYTNNSGEAVANGGYIMVCKYSTNGVAGKIYVNANVKY